MQKSVPGLKKLLENAQIEESFSRILPHAVQMCLDLPARLTQPIPILKRGENGSVTLSQRQIASLLANAMFCTFPSRGRSKGSFLPDVNFNWPYAFNIEEKLKGLINCFDKMAAKKDEDEGLVTFERRHMPPNELPEWETCQSVISAKLHIDAVGTVVEHGHGGLCWRSDWLVLLLRVRQIRSLSGADCVKAFLRGSHGQRVPRRHRLREVLELHRLWV